MGEPSPQSGDPIVQSSLAGAEFYDVIRHVGRSRAARLFSKVSAFAGGGEQR